MKFRIWLLPLALLPGCASMTSAPDTLDRIAVDYVRTQLEIGEREPGYIDAYYGPAEWQAAAKASPRTVEQLAAVVDTLEARVAAIEPDGLDPLERRRRDFMLGSLKAADTRLRMLRGETLSFADEAEGLFGYRPELKPLSDYDPVIARIERLVPGAGSLPDRVDAFQNRFTIPKDRLKPVFDAAIAECRRRTRAHIALPTDESFTMEFVTGKSWSGYNWYQGGNKSLIQVNTDLPIRISRAVDLGCHEGYPGHHVYNVLLEEKLARGRGWVEFTVNPLYSPQSIISEGSANYGIELAFPEDEALKFELSTLYPLAGISPADAQRYHELLAAISEASHARFTIARDYLEGAISRDQAVALTQRYLLVSKARAEQSIAFTEQYRSYVINYGLGLDLVRNWVRAQGYDQPTRWAAMERLLSEPTLPSELVPGPPIMNR